MSKIILVAVLGLCIGAAVVVVYNRPEPTPAERLEDAVKDAGDALKDAGNAISDGARDAKDGIERDLTTAAAELAEMAAASSEKLSDKAVRLVTAWQETGILTEDGFNYDNAIKAVEDSSLDGQTKDRITTILNDIREAPETINEKLRELRAVLETAE